MFEVGSYNLAVVLSLVSTVCWGSWAVPYKVVEEHVRWELFYWDFAVGEFISSIAFATGLGHDGPEGPFTNNIKNAVPMMAVSAVLAGMVFNIGNLLLLGGISIAGMSIAFPIAVGSSLALGTALTYMVEPTANPALLFPGVALAVVAVLAMSMAHHYLHIDKNPNAARKRDDQKAYMDGEALLTTPPQGFMDGELPISDHDAEQGIYTASDGLTALASPPPSKRKCFLICLAAGLFVGSWAVLMTYSMKDPSKEHIQQGYQNLNPYASFVLFSTGILVSTFPGNMVMMRFPLAGVKLGMRNYKEISMRAHLLGLGSGLLWGTGTILNLISGKKAGFAISYSIGSCGPVFATLWGIVIFKEFTGASRKTIMYTIAMFICYSGAIAAIALSKESA